jgi:hypothetical protein
VGGGQRGVAVARSYVDHLLAGADIGRFGQRFADYLQGDADDGEIAAGPGGLLALLDGAEVRRRCRVFHGCSPGE